MRSESSAALGHPVVDRAALVARFRAVRARSVELCRPLAAEDYRIQSMPSVSPPWWNLGHTTWFFAKNVLEPRGLYRPEDARLEYVMNSYYEALGPRVARDRRGLLTRPTTDEVYAFRASVDERMVELLTGCAEELLEPLAGLVEVGCQHEQQHQELLVTEVKHIRAMPPAELREAYPVRPPDGRPAAPRALRFAASEGGVCTLGNLEGGWCWDNELPVHRVFLEPFELGDRLVTNGEWLEFMADGGYADPLLWLSNGWDQVRAEGWRHPLYWEDRDGEWAVWTLGGARPLDPAEPVCHVSFYEAEAFARWKAASGREWSGVRLPTEGEWEHAARGAGFDPAAGNFLESGFLHPRPAAETASGVTQLGGDLWEWTTSHYEPYPRYRPFGGALMEYNGKFMDNQRVLRGGSCATPRDHIRVSYRNFWPAATRFQLTGVRLARSLG